MIRRALLTSLLAWVSLQAQARSDSGGLKPAAKRLVVLMVDGLNADLLDKLIQERDVYTGQSRLPWIKHIFWDNGTVFRNFYVRGISLSAPSWSMLETGRSAVIRGNVEYDRYTGRIYDYLNFFPFYLNYARLKEVDMPGVEVLDRAGLPLLIDSFPYQREYQSFQLFGRGVRWTTLRSVLKRRLKVQLFLAPVESVGPTSLGALLGQQTEAEVRKALANPQVMYADYYDGDIDHEGHLTNQLDALADVLHHIDSLAGRIWSMIENGPLAKDTVMVIVSDHGMNNRPGVTSEAFSLPDFFASPNGGAHHVITNRHQLSDYKVMGLDPMVQRVVNPSSSSFYLSGEAGNYPTAWFDLDGNERAGVYLRSSDLNRMHILLKQLSRKDLAKPMREAAGTYLAALIERHSPAWHQLDGELTVQLQALRSRISKRKEEVGELPHKWTSDEHGRGEDKVARRKKRDLTWWEREEAGYTNYLAHLRKLMAWQPGSEPVSSGSIHELIQERSLGDLNSLDDLRHYVVGPGEKGLVLNASGTLDDERSFRFVDYPAELVRATVRNNPQPALEPNPIDFVALPLSHNEVHSVEASAQHGFWLYGGENQQLVVLTNAAGEIALRPRCGRNLERAPWVAGLPLHLWEDSALDLPPGTKREEWLQNWHTENDWFRATHLCRYSNGVIGIVEQLSPIGERVPGPPGLDNTSLAYERRRRELVTPDMQVFAKDGWNFNVRNFNPGGNHGSFLRISTHSVWMMAGAGIPKKTIEEPYDSLNFASTFLALMGKQPPLPERVVPLR